LWGWFLFQVIADRAESDVKNALKEFLEH